MRSRRFAAFALDTLKSTPGVTKVQTLADAGESKIPNGLVVVVDGKESRWGIVGQLADGERHEHEDQPQQGTPATWTDPVPGDNTEGWMAAAIGRAESPEIARIERWSTREGARPGNEGVTVFFHNTARAFVRKL
ncbi:hypothetical protein AB0D49_21890 [Streptomyces sp. NPDC048290]|uniref:hypothetical protein n=1 Tax=Streptomyces sp. NPDC048290 TaxID=3155811 RepID=UPI0034313451